MKKTTKALESELNSCGKMPLIEYKVHNLKTNEIEFIVAEFYFEGNYMRADIDSLTQREVDNDRFHVEKLAVDDCLSLDEHLQDLAEKVSQAIQNGDLFDLEY